MNLVTFDNRKKFTIYCKQANNEIELKVDPEGWNTDDIELTRNEDYHGIFTKLSNSLKFVEDGRDFINFNRKIYGINCELILTQYIKHPKTDKWVKRYWGYLDLSTWNDKNGKVSVKYNSGGLEQELKARDSDDFELERTTSVNGNTIDEIIPHTVKLDGRRIFLKSIWEAKINAGEDTSIKVSSNDGNTRDKTKGFPLKLISKSHEQAHDVISITEATEGYGSTGIMILNQFDRPREVRIHSNNLKFKPVITNADYEGSRNWGVFAICVTSFKNGINYQLKERRILFSAKKDGFMSDNFPPEFLNAIHDLNSISNNTYQISFNETFYVEAGDSIAIEIFIKSNLADYSFESAWFRMEFPEVSGRIYAEENSVFPPSSSKFFFYHDVFERLTKIITNNKNKFRSDFFGRMEKGYEKNGSFAYAALTHGFWIRGFDKEPPHTEEEPNLYKPLTTSFSDAIQSAQAIYNVGLGIEVIENVETLIVEDLKYFYNPNVTIKLPNQVKNVSRSEAEKYYYSSIEIGYEKGGEYEEAQGLDEPNGKSTFTTIISRVKNTYDGLSKYRSDKYAQEFARRKPVLDYSTTDTSYDEDIHVLDLKKGNVGDFLERKWQDDFEQAPTGIFSPETATNLRLSPVNNLLRHGWTINSGLTNYPSDYVIYGSSSGNSNLKTKQIGKPEYSENGKIINTELDRARFVNEWIEFEHECSYEILNQVQGYSIINGKKTPNIYGLVEFINEDGNVEKGYLFSLKPNGSGKWKILKQNK